MVIKRFSIILLCCIIAFCPLIALCDYSYAEATGPDDIEWIPLNSQVNQSITVAVYKAYLWQRSATMKIVLGEDYEDFEKAYSQFSYNMYTTINEKYNLNLPYGQIYYYMSDNAPLQFLYTTSGLQTLDNFYVAWKDYYGINENEEKEVYSGEWFQDDDGNGCYVYTVTSRYRGRDPGTFDPTKKGSEYLFDYNNVSSNVGEHTINYNNSSVKYYLFSKYYKNTNYYIGNNSSLDTSNNYSGIIKYKFSDTSYNYGHVTILKYNNDYYIGAFAEGKINGEDSYTYGCPVQLSHADAINAAASIAQGPLKDLGVAAGKAAIISTGKTGADAVKQFIEDENDTTDVQEVDNPTEGETPTTPPVTPQEPTIPDGSVPTGGIQLPDGSFNFKMPELNINWSLDGLQNKFPLSIPWDMIRIAEALDTTAATPEFDFTVNFTRYTHRFQFDLHAFDTIMGYFRIAIEVLYTFGLIVATRQIFHIY